MQAFPDFAAWDDWQIRKLGEMARKDRSFRLNDSREDLVLTEIDPEGKVREIARGSLSMDRDVLRIGEITLPVAGIRDMATLQNRKLAISTEDHYYELQAPEAMCLRKYLLFRHQIGKDAEEPAEKET